MEKKKERENDLWSQIEIFCIWVLALLFVISIAFENFLNYAQFLYQ